MHNVGGLQGHHARHLPREEALPLCPAQVHPRTHNGNPSRLPARADLCLSALPRLDPKDEDNESGPALNLSKCACARALALGSAGKRRWRSTCKASRLATESNTWVLDFCLSEICAVMSQRFQLTPPSIASNSWSSDQCSNEMRWYRMPSPRYTSQGAPTKSQLQKLSNSAAAAALYEAQFARTTPHPQQGVHALGGHRYHTYRRYIQSYLHLCATTVASFFNKPY